MPTIYTTELNEIMKQCYNEVVTNKTDIIHDLIKYILLYLQQSNITQDIAKCKVKYK